MKITKAYCEQADRIVNIYQARILFSEQTPNACGERKRLDFLCSDEQCRSLIIPPKITGTNYTVSFEKEDKFIAPHYKINSKYKHHPMCDWLIKEQEETLVEEALLAGAVDEGLLPNRYKRVAKGKVHDVIDQFWLDDSVCDEETLVVIPKESVERVKTNSRLRTVKASNQNNKNAIKVASLKSNVLHELVSCFLGLTVEERKKTSLKIGKNGKKRSYYQCFHSIKNLASHSWLENIIFYGGVVITKRYGNASAPKGYILQFYDEITIKVGVADSKSTRDVKVSLYLKADDIRELPFGNQYIEILNTVYENEKTHYIKCFLFLPNNPRYNYTDKYEWKVDVILPSLKYVDFIPALKGTRGN